MRDPGSERAVSTVVGAALLLGILVLAASLYQATAVPAANERVEFRHSERVRADVVRVAGAVRAAGATGAAAPASVALGTRYPSRGFFVNPPPPTGTLQSAPLGAVVVANASSPLPESGDFWNGTRHAYATKRVTYRPTYHVYDGGAPTAVEYGVPVTNPRGAAPLVWSPGADFVDGRRVTVTTLSGSLSRAGVRSVSVDPAAASPSTGRRRRVPVRGGDGNLTLRLPTRFGAATWCSRASGAAVLEDELARNGGYVTRCAVSNGTLTVELAGRRNGSAVTYALGLARVAVDGEARTPSAAYVTPATPTAIPAGGPRTLGVTVRDRYGNPVSGVTVTAHDPQDLLAADTVVSDEHGVASFRYEGAGTGNVTVGVGPSAAERVTFAVAAANATGAGPGDGAGETERAPSISMRVDDFSHPNTNAVEYRASFDVDDATAGFDHVSVRFVNENAGTTVVRNASATRGGVTFSQSWGAGDAWNVTVRAVARTANGTTVTARRSITDTADALNPASANADLAASGDATLRGTPSVTDETRNSPRWTVSYAVTDGDFGHARLAAIALADGGKAATTVSARSARRTLDAGYGKRARFVVKVVVVDPSGAVVDVYAVTDAADGKGP